MRRWQILAFTAIAWAPLAAHDPITTKITWSREISRLMARRCQACHRERGTAMSLVTYEEARPWAKAIKEQALNRTMPPWGAVKGFGVFQNDAGLTQSEIALIADWVEGGAPLGDPAFLPKPAPVRAAVTPHFRQTLAVEGALHLRRGVALVGIRPDQQSSMRLVAHLPGGRVEPLLWLYRYDPRFAHDFYLAAPLTLPAGTVIDGAERVTLLINPSPSPAP